MNNAGSFNRLAPFIQEYVYSHGWSELREVQIAAIQVLLQTDQHLLLSSGTASGKTEAAFLPILTLLTEDPPESLGVLYIGPTKALINDQFQRLEGLLSAADIPVWHWHGDVGRGKKQQMRLSGRGVLQITPESLESLLVNHSKDLHRLFCDLRFVVIDEVHIFMGSDRGQQIICQLNRLADFWRREPRRVGLSATLGEYTLAERWLAAGSERAVITPKVAGGGQRLRLSLEHFCRPPEAKQAADAEDDPYYQYVFRQTQGKKTLIFANNRGETEAVIAALREIAARHRLPDIYHVHHGSISAPLREAAEEAMRDPHQAAVTAATVTLELGIDLGELETVVQLDAPPTVSSFLQRLGRSGRRGGPMEMRLVTSEELTDDQSLPSRLPWQLLQSIAVIELYLKERWIEPVRPPRLPFSLLYHQTMSELLQTGGLLPEQLAQRVLGLPPFAQVSPADYRLLLQHLLQIDHLERLESGELLVGLAGERVVGDWRFYAVFRDSDDYLVRDESHDLGRINNPPDVGDQIALAGRTWEVLDVDGIHRLVTVRLVGGRTGISWSGSGAPVHTRVMQQMRQVLLSSEEYRYLQPGAVQRLAEARQLARAIGLGKRQVLPLGGGLAVILPWMGSRAFRTLERALRLLGGDQLGVRCIGGQTPYYLLVNTDGSGIADLQPGLRTMVSQVAGGVRLLGATEAPRLAKYDEYVPPQLLRKSFVTDQLDLAELQALLTQW